MGGMVDDSDDSIGYNDDDNDIESNKDGSNSNYRSLLYDYPSKNREDGYNSMTEMGEIKDLGRTLSHKIFE